ncbi:MAG: TIGR04282 family arsenosugar biosynthesis glycosyltransferase [Syntrophobacteraceae bacterium]
MKSKQNTLLIFLRYPEPGKVKKRLAKEIGPENAAGIYEKLVRRTLGIACEFMRKHRDAGIILFHTPDDPASALRAKFPGPWDFLSQRGEHLGTRMDFAFRDAFLMGAEKAVLIGTDLADIEAGDLEDAFAKISEKTAVLGPAADGGFYLVGLNRPVSAPFQFEQWGTKEVFSRTAREFDAAGFSVRLARERKDVDRHEDVLRLERDFLFRTSLSVIIPTLTDPARLTHFLEVVQNSIWPGDDIVVVCGDDVDKVSAWPLSSSATCVRAPRGRGIQQNVGAMLAKGDIFLFLHDDTVPPLDFAYLIRLACRDFDTSLGCFRLAFEPSNEMPRLIAGWANLRTALFRLPYGDQGLFCRREVFEKIGGFRRRYLMEDVELVRDCRQFGKLAALPAVVHSSPKRYLKKGILCASLQNHATMLLFALGWEDRELYLRYYGLRQELPSGGSIVETRATSKYPD